MSVSSGSDITIPIQDSPPPPPSPYTNGKGSKGTKDGGGGGDSNAKSAITIIDTTSGGGVDHPDKKTPEPRGDVTVTVGFVNEAYQDHSPDSKQNGNADSKNGKITNGKTNGAISIAVPGADEKMAGERTEIHLNEAVNPELINMNILNTIPDKPNPEYGPYDNMDEYFVPVNQHKKFLRRSEKLYVTKDKRKESHWKKYICWLIGATILATIVTVAVLAGIGLIPQKSPNNFDTDSVVGTTTSTDLASASSSGDPAGSIIIPSTSPDSSLPSSNTESDTPPNVQLDGSHVPASADIQFHITNLNYESALNNKSTERFQQLANELQSEIKSILKSRAGLEKVYSRVSEFAPGSVFVKMRIGWLDQTSTDFQSVQRILSNVSNVGDYSIMPISSYPIVNLCKFNKNGCSQACGYNPVSMEFYCYCEDDLYVLGEDQKTCRALNEATSTSSTTPQTTSTSSEVPYFPEFSSYSPSSEESETSPSPDYGSVASSHEHEHHHEADPTEMIVDQETTNAPDLEPEQPVASQEPEVSQEEPETVTSADIPSMETHPVSQEHHHSSEEMILIASSTTTSTTTEAPAISEVVEHEHHHHELAAPISAETTTTTTSTTTTTAAPEIPVVIPESSEEVTTAENVEREETTDLPPVEHEVKESKENITTSQSQEEHDFGRTDLSDETIKPTEHSLEERHEAENTTLVETPRDVSHEVEPINVPTELPEEVEPVQTTFSPQQVESEESVVDEPDNKSQEAPSPAVSLETEETTGSPVEDPEESEPTTVLPAVEKEKKEDNEDSHLITPMDVLNFNSHETSSLKTTSTPIENVEHHHGPAVTTTTSTTTTESSHVEPPVAPQSQETESSSVEFGSEEGDAVETVRAGGPARSQSLTEASEETATESAGNGAREPRRFSTEIGNSLQVLSGDERTESGKSREELQAPIASSEQGTNATESASVETADEKPETAADVTSVSSEDVSRESVTQNVNADIALSSSEEGAQAKDELDSQNENSPSQSSENSGSGEFSQESPVTSSSVEDDERPESGEVTTFAPKSLQHDIDINFLGNRNEDTNNTEHVQPVVVETESVESEHVNTENDQDKEKLVSVPTPESQGPASDEQSEATTTLPVIDADDKEETSAGEAEERAPVVAVPDPLSHGLEEASGESREEDTTRSVTSSSSEFADPEASIEKQNRDNRDANGEIETPFASSSSQETTAADLPEDEVKTTSLPEAVPSPTTTTTTTTTTTSSTTTTSTTTPANPPEPEVVPEVTTSTTTTVAPVSSSSNITIPITSTPAPSITPSDVLSLSESASASMEGSIDNSHHHDSHEFPTSAGEDASVGGRSSYPSSGSNEGEAFFSDNNSSSNDDLHDNELT